MIGTVREFLLKGFEGESPEERKKAGYLAYIILTAFTLNLLIVVSQFFIGLSPLYLISNISSFVGLIVAVFLFRNRQVHLAGHLMVCSVLTMVIFQNVFRDIYTHDPAIRYRIYLNMASLLGLCLVNMAFFRQKSIIFFYCVVFEVVLFSHSFVIYYNLKEIPGMTAFVWQHFGTVFVGLIALTAIGSWLFDYVNALFEENAQYAKMIEQQNEQLEKMVSERTGALLRSNESLAEFAHIVSHDLKEPLRTISGFVSLISRYLEKQGLMQDEIEEYVAYIKGGTHQMDALINDVLAYSKLNTQEKVFAPVDMTQVIGNVNRTLAKSIYESEAHIKLNSITAIHGDKLQMEQLFQNLISNAIKYRKDDGELRIQIGCTQHGNMMKYYVRDNGIGIAQEHFDKVFQAFKRLHSKVEYEGTGVGLAICKRIVDIHGGNLWVESEEGIGTTFYFTLPKAQTEMPAIKPVVHAA